MRNVFVAFLLATLCCQAVLAQTKITDSLEQRLMAMPGDTNRVNLLDDLAVALRYVNQDKALAFAKEELLLSEQLRHEKGRALAHLRLAMVMADKFNVKEMANHFNEAEMILKKYKHLWAIRNLGFLNFSRGRFFFESGEYEQTVNALLKGLTYYESLNDTVGITRCYGTLAGAYAEMQNFDRAFDYQRKVVETFAVMRNNESNLTASRLNMGSLLLRMKKFAEAIPYLDSAYSWIKEHPENSRFLSAYHSNMGNYYEFQEQYAQALPYYKEGIAIARKSNDYYTLPKIMASLGNCYTNLGKLADAGGTLEEAYQIAMQTKSFVLQNDVLKYLIALEEKRGNYQKALTYTKAKTIVNDSSYSEKSANKILTLEAIYQADKKQQEINVLQKDKQVQALALKNKNFLNAVLMGSVLIILLVGFLLYRNYRQRQLLQQQRIHDLETEKQLLATQSVLRGQEEERSRLAKDLHDGLGGMLSGIKFSLSNMKGNMILKQEDVHKFEYSVEMLDNSIKELRRVAHNLTPESLMKFGLATALKDFCTDISSSGVIQINYQPFGLDGINPESTVSITVYRIIQELVNNAIKHAQAKQILVQLAVQDNALHLTVEDDGIGLEKDKLISGGGGIGWSNIRSRIDYLKGTLDIQSEPGKGTSVTIELSLS